MAERLALAASRVMVRTSGTPLGRLWRGSYATAARLAAAYLSRAGADAVYAQGSLVRDDVVPGISDIDLLAVVGRERDRSVLEARWKRTCARFPVLEKLVYVSVYRRDELEAALGADAYTFGLDTPALSTAAFLGRTPVTDRLGLLERPRLERPDRDWRPLRGRPLARSRTERHRLAPTAAWGEVQTWWRFLLQLCQTPERPWAAYLCTKLVAEPARALLWLEDGAAPSSRREVLELAVRRFPEEGAAIERALATLGGLAEASPPVGAAAATFVRLCDRLAGRIDDAAGSAGEATRVRLVADGPEELLLACPPSDELRRLVGGPPRLLPLADWRARTVPPSLDEAIAPVPGDPGDPDRLVAVAAADGRAVHPVLRSGRLLVLPTADLWGVGRFRIVLCGAADPVSFALLAGSDTALFPALRGWSAIDCARRAALEHRAWLERRGPQAFPPPGWVGTVPPPGRTNRRAFALLFTAARAGLFLESVERDHPELLLTASAVARRLGVTESLAAYRSTQDEDRDPPATEVERLRGIVEALPAYAR